MNDSPHWPGSASDDPAGICILACEALAQFSPKSVALLSEALGAALANESVLAMVLPLGGKARWELDMDWFMAAAKRELEAFASDAFDLSERISNSEKPVIAAIGGSLSGPAAELALACQRVVIANTPALRVSFSLARFALPPFLNAARRMQQKIGAELAFALLTDGRECTPSNCLAMQLANELVAADQLMPRAIAAARREASSAGAKAATLAFDLAQADLAQPLGEREQPIARAVYDALLDARQGAEIQKERAARRFASAALGSISRAMVATFHGALSRANQLARRPLGFSERRFQHVGVLGAGLMGAGIACVAARSGSDVVLLDRDQAALDRGMAALHREAQSALKGERESAEEGKAWLARIHPTLDFDDLKGCDIVVEAVFEDAAIKAEATRHAEARLASNALFATNTSTLPISRLAKASIRPAHFIGLHFFSPVPRMPLLEVICGKQTSAETLAHALDFARALGKTPIIVNDHRGFYTSRVIMTYQLEAFEMLAAGIPPAAVEAAGTASGMPLSPLFLSDSVALDLIHQIVTENRREAGTSEAPTPGQALLATMVGELGRPGRKARRGFYDYDEDGKRALWPGIASLVSKPPEIEPDIAALALRLLDVQALEAVRCLDEGVITAPGDGDLGAVLGWNFARWTGGPLAYIDTQGTPEFVKRCDGNAALFGARFAVPDALREIASHQGRVHAHDWSRPARPS